MSATPPTVAPLAARDEPCPARILVVDDHPANLQIVASVPSHLAEDKDEWLGWLAHDLKNYPGGMNLTAGLLCSQATRFQDKRLTQLAENLLHTSTRSLVFVQELLANAAADHGSAPQPSAVNPVEVARAVVRQYAEAAQRKKITIQTEFPSAAIVVLAAASALDQVLDNLVSNALKFSPPGRNVLLAIRPGMRWVECAVCAEGQGVTAGDQGRIFRRYGRLSARPAAGEPSTGLGLSIVRKLVLGMGGELRCDSHPGQGAVFTVRLPKPPANST